MNTRIITLVFGVTFILVGILGFFPNPIISTTGLFSVNAVHNSVHIILGIAFIAAALVYAGHENKVLIFFGVGGLLVTVVEFLTPADMMLGIIHVNQADHWLHLGLGLVVLIAGMVLPNHVITPIQRSIDINA